MTKGEGAKSYITKIFFPIYDGKFPWIFPKYDENSPQIFPIYDKILEPGEKFL
jgi:hypothetical protein